MWEVISSIFIFMVLPASVFILTIACGVSVGRFVTALQVLTLRAVASEWMRENPKITTLGWVLGSFTTIGLSWLFMEFVSYVGREDMAIPKGFLIPLTILSFFNNLLFQGMPPTSPDKQVPTDKREEALTLRPINQ